MAAGRAAMRKERPPRWPQPGRERSPSAIATACSLSDAEATENHAEQLVGAELAGDRRHRLLRTTQLLGKQFQRRRRGREMLRRSRKIFRGSSNRLQVPLAGEERSFHVL